MTKKNILRITSVFAIVAVGFLGMKFLGSTEKVSNKRAARPEIRTVPSRASPPRIFSRSIVFVCRQPVRLSRRRVRQASGHFADILIAGDEIARLLGFPVDRHLAFGFGHRGLRPRIESMVFRHQTCRTFRTSH